MSEEYRSGRDRGFRGDGSEPQWRSRRSQNDRGGRREWNNDRDDRGGKRWDRGDRNDRGGKRWDRGDRNDRGGKRWDRDDRNDRGGKRWDRDDRNDRGGKRWDRGERNDRGGKRWDRDDRGGRGGQRNGGDNRRQYGDRKQNRGTRAESGREPWLPDKVNPKDLDPRVLQAISQLNPENAEKVAKHLVMAGSLLDVDAENAYAHARAAVDRASRIGEVREAAALAAYACGKYTEALREVRAARRLSGSDVLRAVEADCERGLGHPEKALDIIAETNTAEMDEFELAELAIVASGARADMEQSEAGLLVIDDFLAQHQLEDDEALARVLSVKADRLEELGRDDEAADVRALAPVLPEAVSIVDLEEVADADTAYVASDLHGSRKPLVEAYDLMLLDLDGVCYQGSNPVPYAAEGLADARAAGAHMAFVTNNASRSPQAVVDHLEKFGIAAAPEEIMTAAMDGTAILVEKLPPASKVLVVGGEGLRAAVSEAGFQIVESADDKPAAVIQGYDSSVGWAQMSEAAYAINDGALFVATNLDASLPTERGFGIGNGSLVACVQNATGVKPLAGGKPFASIYRRPVEHAHAQRPLAVGDRLNTDIRGARSAGYRSLHVLTGVSTARDVALAERDERPDFLGLDLRALTQPMPGVVKNPTEEWTCGASAGFRVDHQAQVLRDGEALEPEEFVFDLLDYRAFVAAVWEARDNGQFVRLPENVTVVEEYPSTVDEAEGLFDGEAGNAGDDTESEVPAPAPEVEGDLESEADATDAPEEPAEASEADGDLSGEDTLDSDE